MMTAKKFMEDLKSRNISLRRDGGKLYCHAPKGAVTPEIKNNINLLKQEILALVEDPITDLPTLKPTASQLIRGDCLQVLERFKEDSIDFVVTDPSYGLKFMGKIWDNAVPSVAILKECLRVLKPGALAFFMCTPRQDLLSRMIKNLEEAGFETGFTSIYWTYSSGFPKAHNVSKALYKKAGVQQTAGKTGSITKPVAPEAKLLQGSRAGFQPKPAVEIILVVMKPLDQKCYTDQAYSNGKGVTWMDDCRIPYSSEKDKPSAGERTCKLGEQDTVNGSKSNSGWEANETGRFPANLLVSDNVLDGSDTSNGYSRYFSLDSWAKLHMEDLPEPVQVTLPFLVVSKPSKKEKDAGLDNCEDKPICGRDPGQDSRNNPYKIRPCPRKNNHPTVKPVELMTYLIVLGSREEDVVLDPFVGSGTTGIAALSTNRRFIGIEKDEGYFDIAAIKYKKVFMLKNYPHIKDRHDEA
jgi:site-specific DNA-methyltransferase (adenine-specific)